MRPDRDLYFLTIAKAVSLRSTCTSRQVGAVLVNSQYNILSTGYNGVVSGSNDCNGKPCVRANSPSGLNLDSCLAVHAEANALLQCPNTLDIHTAYVTASPCFNCIKLLLNTSCKRILFLDNYPHPEAILLWRKMGREWVQYVPDTDTMKILQSMDQIRSNGELKFETPWRE